MDDETDPRKNARESYSARGLTEGQFEESYAIAGIIERGIRKTGSFHEKLTDYSHAFARTEQFDTSKAESIVRDVFKGRFGETPNALRERLLDRENQVRDTHEAEALTHARQIEPMIREGDTMPWYMAQDRAARKMSDQLGITEKGAKEMMKDAFEKSEGVPLYDHSKRVEDEYHKPRVEERKAWRERSVAREDGRPPAQERPRARRR